MAALVAVNTFRACLLAVTTASLLVQDGTVAAAQEEAAAEPLPQNVLFIGNSHTHSDGGLDYLIGNFAREEDPPRPFEGRIITEGGATLQYHWENGAQKEIRQGDFDTVVLQGYLPGSESRTAEPFLEHARLFDEIIEQAGADTVFFMTWPRGFNDWSDIDDVIEAHRIAEAELGATVAPAALAFELASAERPDLQLVDGDHIHATGKGAYLAAATVYATLFDRSPEGSLNTFGINPPEDAAFLQRIAWEAVTEWRKGATPTETE